jgi:hypothetical protein
MRVFVCVHRKELTVRHQIIYCERDSSEPKGPTAYILCRSKDKIIYSPIILISLTEYNFLQSNISECLESSYRTIQNLLWQDLGAVYWF